MLLSTICIGREGFLRTLSAIPKLRLDALTREVLFTRYLCNDATDYPKRYAGNLHPSGTAAWIAARPSPSSFSYLMLRWRGSEEVGKG